ncbi:zinc finger CCHC domain-containing protein 8 [Hyla sarda]|uniref:zinc finger CCHC domain-containing protein 8 n=1 Tax=Hyla sarda TaxID=327740 RepID=UPI0024C31CB1|nr:zinc finger CCHC domain-containing protein 8 [Hyla sarda]
MAEVEFGDSELFEQLDGDAIPQAVHVRFDQTEDSEAEASSFQEQLARCEETVAQLRAENQELRRKLSILSRPSGLSVEDKFDGPLLQILFMNHVISKQYHQEIEDFVSSLVHRHEEEKKANPEKTTFNIKPQPSSISLEASDGVNVIKKIKEAFSVVGSVLYFTNFCLDKLGQPLLNENPQLTDGWEVPIYQQVFGQILALDGQEVQVKAKRPKPCCFNCGLEDHQLKDCPKPRDFVHIGKKRKEFMESCGESGNQSYQQRYHVEEVAERFGKFKAGIISEELREALGISDRHLPPFIYRMRELGYPPGWLKDAELENSGLSLYDGKVNSDGEIVEEGLPKGQISYDVSKLISYPGFNTPTAPGVSDDWRSFGSIPMNADHQKEVFAEYLSCNFPDPGDVAAQKRSSSSHSSSDRKRQKTSANDQWQSPVDMDVESDSSFCSPSQGFKFQPPLPPGSPYNTPPPLPRGTPPSTPPNFVPRPPLTPTPPPLPKGTPPPTPSRGSPLHQSRERIPTQPKTLVSMDEDTLTLEELEEQQRLIWAALENAESTNSDSDIHTPLNGNSVSSSPSRVELDSVTEGKTTCQNVVKELNLSDLPIKEVKQEANDIPLTTEEDGSFNTDPNGNIDDKEMDGKEPRDVTDADKETCVKTEDATEEAACVDASPSTRIPDRSKFAEGITPFEFDNMSESTGTYLRLRGVLKNSPRNQQKNKKGM